jgi:hypothetical protein
VDDPKQEAATLAMAGAPYDTDTGASEHQRLSARDFSDKISYAFQLATAQGPLCSEPIQGIAVFVEDMTASATGWEELGRLTGEVIRSVRDAVWQGFLDWSPRILLAMYSCEIQASSKHNNSSTALNPPNILPEHPGEDDMSSQLILLHYLSIPHTMHTNYR